MARVVKAIDKFVKEHKKDRMAGFVTFLTKDDKENRDKLKEFAKKHKISIPLTISIDPKGLKPYKLNKAVPITILVSKRNKVEANFVLAKPAPSDSKAQTKEAEDIIAAAGKMLKK